MADPAGRLPRAAYQVAAANESKIEDACLYPKNTLLRLLQFTFFLQYASSENRLSVTQSDLHTRCATLIRSFKEHGYGPSIF